MPLKILSIKTILEIILTGCVFFAVLLFYSSTKISIQSNFTPFIEHAVVIPKQQQITYQVPVRLNIPSINVDAAIEYVGLTPKGAMDVPNGPFDVAWFKTGTRPGDSGSAVISGHYGTWKDGQESVFDNLSKLQKGDKLYIEDEKGMVITFIVRESKNYDPEADASDVFYSKDGKAHLNLVTCEGIWDNAQKTYSDRLVVFTDKE